MAQLSKDGYIILKNAISPKTIKMVQSEINSFLSKRQKNSYEIFIKSLQKYKINEFDLIKKIHENVMYKELIDKLLLNKKLYLKIAYYLGRDISYCSDISFALNIPKKNLPRKNYLFKDWHQEIWSGANSASLQIWTPIFQKKNEPGQIEIIKGSHKWGHVPHKNRSPINLPKKLDTIKINIKEGDVIIFSTLLLHRSVPAKHPRLAMATCLKNFKYKNYSFEDNRNWKILSYSEITEIERVLGNHHLSPFRVTDLETDILSGTVKKNN